MVLIDNKNPCGSISTHTDPYESIWQCVKTNSIPSVHIKIAGLKWMFIPLTMVLIGIDPYPYESILIHINHYYIIHMRFAISARAVHLIALEPKVRSFGTLAVLVQTSPRCWDFGAQTKETTKATKARQMRSPQPGARMPSTHKKVLKSPTKKDDQHTRCSAKMPMTYLVKAVKNKLGALKGAKA